jgi:uncharacterized protein YoxC
MKEILRDKEEEIKKLKSDLSLVIKERDDNIKQNKKLKSDLAFKNTMLDNVKAEYESLHDFIRKLKKRVKEHTTYSIKAEFIKKF